LVGAFRSYKNGNIEVKLGLIFAIPSLIAVWVTRAIIIPSIPNELFVIGNLTLTKDMSIMIFFALIMILSSYTMIRSKTSIVDHSEESRSASDNFKIVLEGLVVGLVTGIIGAGGGFLIIPALVLLAKLPMKKAVGTSLMIIAIKSLIGFTGDLTNPEIIINWNMLLIFTMMSVFGIFIGIKLAKKISGPQLKKGFGWFLLIMGIYILSERISHLL
jgi:uncharacterized membrane protein YfcA